MLGAELKSREVREVSPIGGGRIPYRPPRQRRGAGLRGFRGAGAGNAYGSGGVIRSPTNAGFRQRFAIATKRLLLQDPDFHTSMTPYKRDVYCIKRVFESTSHEIDRRLKISAGVRNVNLTGSGADTARLSRTNLPICRLHQARERTATPVVFFNFALVCRGAHMLQTYFSRRIVYGNMAIQPLSWTVCAVAWACQWNAVCGSVGSNWR
jgi:hypothetical protein